MGTEVKPISPSGPFLIGEVDLSSLANEVWSTSYNEQYTILLYYSTIPPKVVLSRWYTVIFSQWYTVIFSQCTTLIGPDYIFIRLKQLKGIIKWTRIKVKWYNIRYMAYPHSFLQNSILSKSTSLKHLTSLREYPWLCKAAVNCPP